MGDDYINIIFVMENQKPNTLKVLQQIQIKELLSLLKKKSVQKDSFQTNEIVIMIPPKHKENIKIEPKVKPKEFFASSAFQCAPEAHLLPLPDDDLLV